MVGLKMVTFTLAATWKVLSTSRRSESSGQLRDPRRGLVALTGADGESDSRYGKGESSHASKGWRLWELL